MKRHTFLGNAYRILFLPMNVISKMAHAAAAKIGDDKPERVVGLCDSPDTKDKAIRLAEELGGLKKLDAALHESLHACFWHLSEDTVCEAATDVSRYLWRMGVRWKDEL